MQRNRSTYLLSEWLRGLVRLAGDARRSYTGKCDVHQLVITVRKDETDTKRRAILDLLHNTCARETK